MQITACPGTASTRSCLPPAPVGRSPLLGGGELLVLNIKYDQGSF